MQTISAPQFSVDWSQARSYWPEMFKDFGLVGKPGLNFLEIGCFEGQSTLWLLENILTHPTSAITVIDTFEGSPEFEELNLDGNCLDRFEDNVAEHAMKITVMQGRSSDVLRLAFSEDEDFDFVYVDASHLACDVLSDAVLSWPLLRAGGIMVFDDYRWGHLDQTIHDRPKLGIDAFVAVYEPELIVRHSEYQFVVEKR